METLSCFSFTTRFQNAASGSTLNETIAAQIHINNAKPKVKNQDHFLGSFSFSGAT